MLSRGVRTGDILVDFSGLLIASGNPGKALGPKNFYAEFWREVARVSPSPHWPSLLKVKAHRGEGSAADAQHLATELTVRYRKDRAPIAAIALTTDTSALTAIGNDLGFDQLFARQIAALGRPSDVAIAISTSGNSPNVLAGIDQATSMGMAAAGLTGGAGGKMTDKVDPLLIVPSATTARIQEMHIMLGQMLCGALELELDLVTE